MFHGLPLQILTSLKVIWETFQVRFGSLLLLERFLFRAPVREQLPWRQLFAVSPKILWLQRWLLGEFLLGLWILGQTSFYGWLHLVESTAEGCPTSKLPVFTTLSSLQLQDHQQPKDPEGWPSEVHWTFPNFRPGCFCSNSCLLTPTFHP